MLLFAQKGYASTSVADILQAAGVNAGSLYYFFPGKQDVLVAVLDAYLHGIHPMLLQPAWKGVTDRYRSHLESTDCTYGSSRSRLTVEASQTGTLGTMLRRTGRTGRTNTVTIRCRAAKPTKQFLVLFVEFVEFVQFVGSGQSRYHATERGVFWRPGTSQE